MDNSLVDLAPIMMQLNISLEMHTEVQNKLQWISDQ